MDAIGFSPGNKALTVSLKLRLEVISIGDTGATSWPAQRPYRGSDSGGRRHCSPRLRKKSTAAGTRIHSRSPV